MQETHVISESEQTQYMLELFGTVDSTRSFKFKKTVITKGAPLPQHPVFAPSLTLRNTEQPRHYSRSYALRQRYLGPKDSPPFDDRSFLQIEADRLAEDTKQDTPTTQRRLDRSRKRRSNLISRGLRTETLSASEPLSPCSTTEDDMPYMVPVHQLEQAIAKAVAEDESLQRIYGEGADELFARRQDDRLRNRRYPDTPRYDYSPHSPSDAEDTLACVINNNSRQVSSISRKRKSSDIDDIRGEEIIAASDPCSSLMPAPSKRRRIDPRKPNSQTTIPKASKHETHSQLGSSFSRITNRHGVESLLRRSSRLTQRVL